MFAYLMLGPNSADIGGPKVFSRMWLNIGDLLMFMSASING